MAPPSSADAVVYLQMLEHLWLSGTMTPALSVPSVATAPMASESPQLGLCRKCR